LLQRAPSSSPPRSPPRSPPHLAAPPAEQPDGRPAANGEAGAGDAEAPDDAGVERDGERDGEQGGKQDGKDAKDTSFWSSVTRRTEPRARWLTIENKTPPDGQNRCEPLSFKMQIKVNKQNWTVGRISAVNTEAGLARVRAADFWTRWLKEKKHTWEKHMNGVWLANGNPKAKIRDLPDDIKKACYSYLRNQLDDPAFKTSDEHAEWQLANPGADWVTPIEYLDPMKLGAEKPENTRKQQPAQRKRKRPLAGEQAARGENS
jgi:hypothetical protein